MTEEQTTEDQSEDRSRTRAKRGFGWAPVMVAAPIAAVLATLLVTGGFSAVSAMSAPVVVAAKATQAPPTPGTGVETPGAGDPSTPPDRASDQPVASKPEDTVYVIQDGDTLTSISAKLGMSIDAIAAYNAVRDVNVISEGAVLRVPFIYVPPTASVNQ